MKERVNGGENRQGPRRERIREEQETERVRKIKKGVSIYNKRRLGERGKDKEKEIGKSERKWN